MAIASCPVCGKKLRIREELVGKRGKCPGCETFFSVQSDANKGPANQKPEIRLRPEETAELPEQSGVLDDLKTWWNDFYRTYLKLEWPFGRRHLRRCIQCNGKQFSFTGSCVYCQSATVGLDLWAVYSGKNRILLKSAEDYLKLNRRRGRLGIVIWSLTGLIILGMLVAKFWLGILV